MTERAQLAFGEIMDLAVGLGGTITGEHGVGRLKRPWLAGYLGPEAMELNRRIKQALDPARHPQSRARRSRRWVSREQTQNRTHPSSLSAILCLLAAARGRRHGEDPPPGMFGEGLHVRGV